MLRSLVTTTGYIFICWIQSYSWKYFTTIINGLYTNELNCMKQRKKHINKNTTELCFHYCTFVYNFAKPMKYTRIFFPQLKKMYLTSKKYILYENKKKFSAYWHFLNMWIIYMYEKKICHCHPWNKKAGMATCIAIRLITVQANTYSSRML